MASPCLSSRVTVTTSVPDSSQAIVSTPVIGLYCAAPGTKVIAEAQISSSGSSMSIIRSSSSRVILSPISTVNSSIPVMSIRGASFTFSTWNVMTVSEDLTPSLALRVRSELPVESSSSALTERVWPETLTSTRSSLEFSRISSVKPETGTGYPLSSVSERYSVSPMLAEPPSSKDCDGIGAHLGAPFSTTLNIIMPELLSSPSSTVTNMPWGIGFPWLSLMTSSNSTTSSSEDESHSMNSGELLSICSIESGVSAS